MIFKKNIIEGSFDVELNKVGDDQLAKAEGVSFNKSGSLSELTSFSSMDVYLVYETGGTKREGSFQARNFAGSTKGDWKLELKGRYAAQGKIQGEVARKLLKDVQFQNVPDEPDKNLDY